MPIKHAYAPVFAFIFLFHGASLCAQEGGVEDFVGRARTEDAAFDRGMLASRADTLPRGDWTVQSYELLSLGFSAGLTDWLQFSLGAGLQGPVFANLRAVLARRERWVLSTQAEWLLVLDRERGEGAGSWLVLGDWRPNEVFGLYAQAGVQSVLGEAWWLRGALGASAATSPHTALVMEGWLVQGGADEEIFRLEDDVRLFFYGVRYHRPGFAVDVGMIYTPLFFEESVLGGLGLPWLVMTWR